MKLISKITAVSTACLLTLTIAPASYATGTTPSSNSSVSSSDQLSEVEMVQLKKDVEVLFTRYIQTDSSGRFFVNVSNLTADGSQSRAPELQQLADTFNMLGDAPEEYTPGSVSRVSPGAGIQPYGAGEFASCLALNALGIPALAASPGLINVLKEGIRAWNWGLTAKTVARIIGPAAARALGGPVGIGVALGWAAVSCRGKL